MTTSWSAITSHDIAERRAAGRRRINAQRHYRAERRRAQVLQMVMERGGLEHGIRAEIARQIGVSRSTVSRDIKATLYAPREPRRSDHGPTTTALIAALEPLGGRLSAQACECGPESLEEPRHALGHTLRMTAETLDAVEMGTLALPTEDVRSLERMRDRIVELLCR